MSLFLLIIRQWQQDVRHSLTTEAAELAHDLTDLATFFPYKALLRWPLGRFLRRCPPDPRTLERIHRLSGPLVRPSLALVVKEP